MNDSNTQPDVSFDQLLQWVRDEAWDFVDANIRPEHLTPERLHWAITAGLSDVDPNVRDFAVTLFNRSDAPLELNERGGLYFAMFNDSYEIVSHRAAVALYQRGDVSLQVETMMQEAGQSDVDAIRDLVEQAIAARRSKAA